MAPPVSPSTLAASPIATNPVDLRVYHEKVEVGCFVFQVLRSDRVRLRSCPELEAPPPAQETEEDEEGSQFEDNELLAVDLIQPTSHATFLRLADQSGWVVAEEMGELYLRQIPIATGLYQFYIDQVPQTVRCHPMDESSELLVTEAEAPILQPMHKIYCDAAVEHPVTGVKFYRLQGFSNRSPATAGWVHDRQGDLIKLSESARIQSGNIWAYRVLEPQILRSRADCREASKTKVKVETGEILVGNVLRQSPYDNGNGPFVRLTDGTGWMFENILGQKVLEPVPIVTGKWVFSVLNEPVGMLLRRQPVDTQDKVYSDIYGYGALVECDRKIVDGNVNFFRVVGTNGWLFDKRNETPMLRMLSEDLSTTEPEAVQPWEPDFVRGVAATVEHVKESSFQPNGAVLTFDLRYSMVVKVFCRTHTVCTFFLHTKPGTEKLFERHCSPADLRRILGRDLVQTQGAYKKAEAKKKKNSSAVAKEGHRHMVEEEKKEEGGPQEEGGTTTNEATKPPQHNAGTKEKEEDLRHQLLGCDLEIDGLQAQRRELLAAIKVFENMRAKEAKMIKEDADTYLSMSLKTPFEVPTLDKFKKMILHQNPVTNSLGKEVVLELPKQPSTAPINPSVSPTGSTTSNRPTQVCGECFKVFSGKYSRDLHCREVHKLFCPECDQIFISTWELETHQRSAKH